LRLKKAITETAKALHVVRFAEITDEADERSERGVFCKQGMCAGKVRRKKGSVRVKEA